MWHGWLDQLKTIEMIVKKISKMKLENKWN
jgi:hypothetical protein